MLQNVLLSCPFWQTQAYLSQQPFSSHCGLVCVVWSDWRQMRRSGLRGTRSPCPFKTLVCPCWGMYHHCKVPSAFGPELPFPACLRLSQTMEDVLSVERSRGAFHSLRDSFGQLKQPGFWLLSQSTSQGCLWLLGDWKRYVRMGSGKARAMPNPCLQCTSKIVLELQHTLVAQRLLQCFFFFSTLHYNSFSKWFVLDNFHSIYISYTQPFRFQLSNCH